jgi:hypothetical protein
MTAHGNQGTGKRPCEGCGAEVIVAFVRGSAATRKIALDPTPDATAGMFRTTMNADLDDHRVFAYVLPEPALEPDTVPDALNPHVCAPRA